MVWIAGSNRQAGFWHAFARDPVGRDGRMDSGNCRLGMAPHLCPRLLVEGKKIYSLHFYLPVTGRAHPRAIVVLFVREFDADILWIAAD